MSVPYKWQFVKISECGKYGLLPNSELWRIAGKNSYMAGHVMNPEAIEIAVDNAKEEMACLIADARREFGF